MSTFKVEVVRIDEVTNHPNADRLDLLKIKDWQCVSSKGQFKVGDSAVYFPIDSLLPTEVETKIFGIDSKVRLNNSRVRTIKLRGAISQGLAVKPEVVGLPTHYYGLGDDVTDELGVTKYEPPVKLNSASNPTAASKKKTNPNFRKYTGIENAKNYPSVFTEGEEVIVTEKIHGTNFRCGYVPNIVNTLWKKVLKFFKAFPEFEFVYGSHNVQLQSKMLYTGYYDKNVYAETVIKYNLKDVLKPGEVVYGEVYGDGIQKDYTYGCKPGERKLVIFDVMVNGSYLDPIMGKKWVEARLLPYAPVLYTGPFNKEKILELRDGKSVLAPKQKVREGVVVKPISEQMCFMGRKMLKFISDEYLLKNQDNETEAH